MLRKSTFYYESLQSYFSSFEYKLDTKTRFDLAIAQKAVDLFDHYYDNYRQDFVGWKQSEGRINPKLWKPPGAKQPKKKK